ncbi:MAG: DEAD/DEAH box helicase [Flavobacteriales bacterium]|nr:DEAD/DEAH box helicase [Flavobacteriales bacterium]
MTFNDLGLIEPILKALQEEGYDHPTPIQAQAIPHLLQGRDLLGCAQTGTGKTAAFALPIIQHMEARANGPSGRKAIRVLILTPTRELAIQIGDSFKAYGRHMNIRHTVIFGGVGQKPQTDALQRGVEIVVATPGRLLDLMSQGFVHLDRLETFVLDEADRMLDMGFIHDVKKVIAKLPKERQTLLFSATMPTEIAKLAGTILRDPVKVEVTPPSTTAEKVEQALYFVDRTDKNALLVDILQDRGITEALVFTRTKHGANKVAKMLEKNGIRAEAIHGNKSQTARQNALKNFKNGTTRVLVATDIAARGIDIDGLGQVINFDLPNVPETYVHRIGRTGRAGAAGKAISFCDHEEKAYLKDIGKLIRMDIPVVEGHRFEMSGPPKKRERTDQAQQPRHGRGRVHDRSGRTTSSRSDRQRPTTERSASDRHRGNEGGEKSSRRRPRKERPKQDAHAQGNRNSERLGRSSDGDTPPTDRREHRYEASSPDYAAMAKELFGEVLPELKKDQQLGRTGQDGGKRRSRWGRKRS